MKFKMNWKGMYFDFFMNHEKYKQENKETPLVPSARRNCKFESCSKLQAKQIPIRVADLKGSKKSHTDNDEQLKAINHLTKKRCQDSRRINFEHQLYLFLNFSRTMCDIKMFNCL